jgi:hypothetical protein
MEQQLRNWNFHQWNRWISAGFLQDFHGIYAEIPLDLR